MARIRIVGISFDHMHMGDLLRCVHDHPEAEIAGVFDPDRATVEVYVASVSYPTVCHHSGHSGGFDGSRKKAGSSPGSVTKRYRRHVLPSIGPTASVQPCAASSCAARSSNPRVASGPLAEN